MSKKMISLEVSAELKEALRVEAFNQAISISALIRQILENKLMADKPANTSE
jgi:predicted HicB family RNase H-like nuclease